MSLERRLNCRGLLRKIHGIVLHDLVMGCFSRETVKVPRKEKASAQETFIGKGPLETDQSMTMLSTGGCPSSVGLRV